MFEGKSVKGINASELGESEKKTQKRQRVVEMHGLEKQGKQEMPIGTEQAELALRDIKKCDKMSILLLFFYYGICYSGCVVTDY
jgi:hypothetical protein